MVERIYIAGPMTGLPDFNFPAFNTMAAHLRSLGFEVLNPAELDLPHNTPWRDCMIAALGLLLRADSIMLLHNWTASRGAKIEENLAQDLGFTIYHEGSDFT